MTIPRGEPEMGESSRFRESVFAAVAFVIMLGAVLASPVTAESRRGTWRDRSGDVTSANADIVAGSATVWNGAMDIRVRFMNPPFPETHTHFVTWCVDADRNPMTGSACGFGDLIGADFALQIESGGLVTPCSSAATGGPGGTDLRPYLWIDSEGRTLRIAMPLTLFGDDGDFNYVVLSVFGGSFGRNDEAPRQPGFTDPQGSFASRSWDLSFDGVLYCAAR
jgi:hypothetical protein